MNSRDEKAKTLEADTMKLNLFQYKVLELWAKHIDKGLVIEAPPHIGKTQVALYLAHEYANQDTAIIVFCPNLCHTQHTKECSEEMFETNENIYFVPHDNRDSLLGVRHYKKIYYIFDECYNYSKHKEPMTMKIYTETDRSIHRFNVNWYPQSKKHLDLIKKISSDECFRCEYMNCVIDPDE